MICYVGAANNEQTAVNAMKKYGKWVTTNDQWNQTLAMIEGCKLIIGYQNQNVTVVGVGTVSIRVPIYHSSYWMNLLSSVPDNTLYNEVVGTGAPIIEFDFDATPGNPRKPSDFIRRSANLPAALVPIDTKVRGITPVWAGSPDMGWLGDT